MNPQRGEYKFNVEGVGDVILRLNMGSLAEIEEALGCRTVGEMVVRIGNLGVKDVLDILRPLVEAGDNEGLPPLEDWPPVFGEYTVAIGECFFASGFLRRPKEESAGPNSEGQ